MYKRQAFSDILLNMMKDDERIVVMEADLGGAHKTIQIREKYPGRFFDCGIAEQAMVSIAGGLSAYGFIPVASTFTPFMARRACDQITISCLYAKQNVKLFGSDPGVTAENNGGTQDVYKRQVWLCPKGMPVLRCMRFWRIRVISPWIGFAR